MLTCYQLNQVNLCKNPLRSLQASAADMPALASFPKAHVITFRYYLGVISFLEEDYSRAEEHLTAALGLLPSSISTSSKKNHQLILTYLIPTRLLTSHLLPTIQLLKPYPQLQTLFMPLARCIREGDLAGFDRALAAGGAEFVKRRIYLTLERGRDIALRNLFRKVFIAGGFEPAKEGEAPVRRTRVPIVEFVAAVNLSLTGVAVQDRQDGVVPAGQPFAPEEIEKDEVECFIANLVYKVRTWMTLYALSDCITNPVQNLMKGYISRTAEKAVLSKAGAFPGTGV